MSISAVLPESAAMRATIFRYKYDRRLDWSLIFGRLLVAWLDVYARADPPDLIVANPTFVGEDASFAHTEKVLEAAANEDRLGEWPFDAGRPRRLVKVSPAKGTASAGIAAKRIAHTRLYHSLQISDRSAFEGRRVLVYDHQAVTGRSLNTVASFLREECGAASVEGFVLTRSVSEARKRVSDVRAEDEA